MSQPWNNLGLRVRYYRHDVNHFTQAQLGHLAGASPSYIARIETGKIPDPSVSKIARIARALGVSVGTLADSEAPGSQSVMDAIRADPRLNEQRKRALATIVQGLLGDT